MAIPCEVTAGQLGVRGISLAGVQTCLQIPQLDLLFDAGHCPRSFAGTKRLFLTHGHGDHAGGLIGMLSHRTLYRMNRPLQVWAPAPICADLEVAVAAYERIQGLPYRWTLHPLEPGDEVPLGGARVLRAFESVHVIHTLGYTVWERVQKLKPEYLGLPGPEIGRRKKAGEPLFDELERPIVSFPGDTTIQVLDRQPHLLESRVLILEATYLDDRRTVQQCLDHGHVHLDQIIERASAFRNEHLVLTHFSQSYGPREVRALCDERLPDHLAPQVHPLLPHDLQWPG